MTALGLTSIAPIERLAVMGFAEVLPRVPYFIRLKRKIERMLDENRPDAVLLVDYPGFNLRVAAAAHRRGIPVLYYIAPQVWAWRRARAQELAQVADRIAVIFPFEVDLFRAHGGSADYVGHPLLDRPDHVDSREAFYDRWGLDPDRRLLALLPGSRAQEVKRHLELFVEVAGRVRAAVPDVLPVLSRAPSLSAIPFHVTGLPLVEDTRGLLRHSSAALVKSGTATLEAALEGTPQVVAYRTSRWTATLARRLVDVEHFALPNVVAGRGAVPEFFQGAARSEALASVLVALLEEGGAARREQEEAIDAVKASLGAPGAAGRVASMLDEMVSA